MSTHSVIGAGPDVETALSRLEMLREQMRARTESAEGQAQEPAPATAQAPAEPNFEDPKELQAFMNTLHASEESESAFSQHVLDPARVAELLDLE